MKEWTQSPYGAVPVEEQESDTHPGEDSALHNHHTTVEHSTVNVEEENKPQPQPLEASWLNRGLRLVFDLIVASVALLFAVFGIWVYRIDGSPAGPESTGSHLFKFSRYVSYLYPILSHCFIPACSLAHTIVL